MIYSDHLRIEVSQVKNNSEKFNVFPGSRLQQEPAWCVFFNIYYNMAFVFVSLNISNPPSTIYLIYLHQITPAIAEE